MHIVFIGGAPFVKNQEPHVLATYFKKIPYRCFICKIKQYKFSSMISLQVTICIQETYFHIVT